MRENDEYTQSVVDGFGHVSARHDTNPARFWLSRSMASRFVTAEDIMAFDLDGSRIDARVQYLSQQFVE
jgi:ribulose-5-phosphate 4-epimerase/fuculose-1-phosphate aldolase